MTAPLDVSRNGEKRTTHEFHFGRRSIICGNRTIVRVDVACGWGQIPHIYECRRGLQLHRSADADQTCSPDGTGNGVSQRPSALIRLYSAPCCEIPESRAASSRAKSPC